MFGKIGGFMKQMQMAQKLMKDENFKNFISNPKVQAAFQDPAFREAAQSQDPQKILSHPKMAALRSDPEILALLSKVDFKDLMK